MARYMEVRIIDFPTTWNITTADCLQWFASGGEVHHWQATAGNPCELIAYAATSPIDIFVECNPETELLTVRARCSFSTYLGGLTRIDLFYNSAVAPDVFAANVLTCGVDPSFSAFVSGGGVTVSQA